TCRKRPRGCCAAAKRDELASPHAGQSGPFRLGAAGRSTARSTCRRRAGQLLGPHLNCSESYVGCGLPPVLPSTIAHPTREKTPALREFRSLYVRFGSGADIARLFTNVRFPPESGQTADVSICPLCATTGCEQSQQGSRLFDDRVGAGEHSCGHLEAQRLGGLEIDH